MNNSLITKVVIFTEGDLVTGMGHISRCAALAAACEERGLAVQLVINTNHYFTKVIAQDQPHLDYLRFDWMSDQNKLTAKISQTDIVVIDSYHAPKNLYQLVSDRARLAVYYDDYQRLDYPPGVIINPATNQDVSYGPGHHLLLGPAYVSLRREFWSTPNKIINKQIRTVLVTMGESPQSQLSALLLNLIQQTLPTTTHLVLVGKQKAASFLGNKPQVYGHVSAIRMRDLMNKADIAITGGGQTLLEVISTGTPTLAIQLIDNQHFNLKMLTKHGCVEVVYRLTKPGLVQEIKTKLLYLRSAAVRRQLSASCRKTIDGQGARRIVRQLLDLV